MNPYLSAFLIAGIVFNVGAFVIFIIESPNDGSEIQTLLDAYWWSVATMTTVGYGDVTPVTDIGRVVGIFYMFFGIAVGAMFLTLFGTRFYQKKIAIREKQAFSHAEETILGKIDELEKHQKNEFEKIQNQINELKEKITKSDKA